MRTRRYERAAIVARSGADLAAYNTTESAADLDDLRTALGIPKWNVSATPTASSSRETYMHLYPGAIRAVVLDGVVPADQASYGLLWSASAKGSTVSFGPATPNPHCRRRTRDLGRTFNRLVREAASDPVTTTVKTADGKRVKVVLDASALVSWLVVASHLPTGAPAAIDALADGRPRPLAEQYAPGGSIPQGSSTSPGGSSTASRAPSGQRAGRRRSMRGAADSRASRARFGRTCHRSPSITSTAGSGVCRRLADAAQPTVSDIPTLIINGSFDAQTAASNGAIVAESLSNSTIVIIPGAAHGTFFESPCAAGLITSFFDAPAALDTSCVAETKPAEFNVE